MKLSKLQRIYKKRLDRLVDSVPHLPMFRADDQLGIFARHLVHETLAEVFRHEFEETKWANGELLPIDTSLDEGALEYGYHEIISSGRSKIVADDATDIPLVDVKGDYQTHGIKTVACKFRYSTAELRAAQRQGIFNLVEEKSLSAREGHDFGLNDLYRDGAPGKGLHGATNAPGIIVQTAATSGLATTATAAQIVSVISLAINTVINESKGVEVPNTVAMPVDIFTRISTLQNSTASDITVLQYLRQAFPMITNWVWEPGMSTASGAGGPAIMVYRKDPSRMRGVEPMTLVPLPPEQKGLTFEVVLESRFGGVMAPKPRSVLRLENV